jgi:hypothetical protein
VVGLDKFANVDIRVRVTGGGHVSQVYAIRQAISKSIVAYYQKFVDEHSKNTLKQALVQYDRTLLVADNRRCEPKKFGGGLCCFNVGCERSNDQFRSRCESQIPKVIPLSVGCLWVWVWESDFCCICNGWECLFAGCRILNREMRDSSGTTKGFHIYEICLGLETMFTS